MQITKDRVVTIEYTTTDKDDQIIDTTDNIENHSFIFGRGNIFKTVEEAMEGRYKGAQLNLTLSPEQAYGVRDESLIKQVPRQRVRVPDGDLEIGFKLKGNDRDNSTPITVVAFDDETVTLDANNPLAGLTVNIKIVVVDVREADEEELKTNKVTPKSGRPTSVEVAFG
ncbi:peptidylprolyl isomerase [Pseudomonadota bacterium]